MEKRKEMRDKIRRTNAFRSTNGMWNYLSLNQGWSIGLLMKIVGNKRFKSFNEWETYYLKSGEERKKALAKLPKQIRKKLEDLRAHYTDPPGYKEGLESEHFKINHNMGRTMEDLEFLATVLYDEVKRTGNPFKLTLEDCINHVYIRVIDEIYIGIQREDNTLATLEKEFPQLRFENTNPYVDRKYAIDAEVYQGKKLLCGIQIKSPYYLKGKTDEMKKSFSENESKIQKYKEEFKTEAFFLYSEVTGEIKNPEILTTIKNLTH